MVRIQLTLTAEELSALDDAVRTTARATRSSVIGAWLLSLRSQQKLTSVSTQSANTQKTPPLHVGATQQAPSGPPKKEGFLTKLARERREAAQAPAPAAQAPAGRTAPGGIAFEKLFPPNPGMTWVMDEPNHVWREVPGDPTNDPFPCSKCGTTYPTEALAKQCASLDP